MKNVFVRFLFSASYRLKEWTDPAFFSSPYEQGTTYEKPFNFKKHFAFRKKMGFHV